MANDPAELKANFWWLRDSRNPILPPGGAGEPDAGCCMNPYILRLGDTYHLYYAGADDDGRRRICLATAAVDDLGNWERHGPLFDLGPPGSFDAKWCVLPHVIQLAPDLWHLYYTGNCGQGSGLNAFPGIGLATSSDGKTWEKHPDSPVIGRTGIAGDPDREGIAGGSVLRAPTPDGGSEWRFYYTGCPTLGDDLFLNQQKRVCLAVSDDGVQWGKRGALMLRDPERDYENVAVAGPVVQLEDDGSYRMWYSAIGKRWGAYSIAYAESDDGLEWRRGSQYGDNLQLGPSGQGWERQMVEYPAVIREGSRHRLFYCGNGYGSSGIGTAVSSPLRATAQHGPCAVRIVAPEAKAAWHYRLPEGLSCREGVFKIHHHPIVDWHGPDANGAIWHEWQTSQEDFEIISAYERADEFGMVFIQGLRYRVIISPADHGLDLRFTVENLSDRTFHNVDAFPCLGHPTENFEDNELERTFIVTAAGLTPLKDTDRGTDTPIRTHYHVVDCEPRRFVGEPFWGGPSATVATSGAILRQSADGRHTIGTNWEAVSEIYQNEDSHHCIHSVATVGDVAPGETSTVRGRLVLVEGGPEQALELLDFG